MLLWPLNCVLVTLSAIMHGQSITYSPAYLKCVNQAMTREQLRLNATVYQHLECLGIAKIVHRAYRGGRQRAKQQQLNNSPLIHIKPQPRKPACHGPPINMALWNARSIRPPNKITATIDFIIDHNIDVFAITESWLKGDSKDQLVVSDILSTLPDYEFCTHHRKGKGGGGLAFIVRKSLHIKKKAHKGFRTFELLDVSITTDSRVINLVLLYRPPSASVSEFLIEFSTLLETLVLTAGHLVLFGDFNIHVDKPTQSQVSRFLSMLDVAGFTQHVKETTHVKGHVLDLLVTRTSEQIVNNISVNPSLPSDHYVVSCTLAVPRPPKAKKVDGISQAQKY